MAWPRWTCGVAYSGVFYEETKKKTSTYVYVSHIIFVYITFNTRMRAAVPGDSSFSSLSIRRDPRFFLASFRFDRFLYNIT